MISPDNPIQNPKSNVSCSLKIQFLLGRKISIIITKLCLLASAFCEKYIKGLRLPMVEQTLPTICAQILFSTFLLPMF